MIILGIDTATATASAALVEDGKVISEETRPGHPQGRPLGLPGRGSHAQILLPLVDTVLKRAGLSLYEVSAFAVSIGPGSFTGLRIGLSTVKGLAYGWNVPVIGVPTLFAFAALVTDWEGLICPFLDARRKEAYAALFRKDGKMLRRLCEDLVSSPEGIIRQIRSSSNGEPCLFIGDGTKGYGELIKSSLGDRGLLTLGDSYESVASAVARLGEERLLKHEFDPPATLAPLYLRPSEAELKRGL